jgi:dihydroorotase-like cyclic amidohydrolase
MAIDTVIKNCMVVKPEGIFSLGIGIDKGKIVLLTSDEYLPEAATVIDAGGKYVIPGLVDPHVHLPWPPKDTFPQNIGAETRAFAAGGCTTVAHMLRGKPNILEEAEQFKDLYDKSAYIDSCLSVMVMDLEHVKQIPEAIRYGMLAYKFYMPYRVGTEYVQGLPQMDDGIMYLGFKAIGELVKKGYNIHARVHAENIEIFNHLMASYVQKGVEPSSWHETRPGICETEAALRAIHFAEVTECPLYIIHVSAKETVDIIAEANAHGYTDISGETCIQYLTLNVSNTDKNLSKVNPPIREAADNDKLWEGIKSGAITMVGTDHTPILTKHKADFWKARVGLSIAEWWLPLMLSEGVHKGRITLPKLVELSCYTPAKVYGLTPQKGMIEAGSDADIVIIDMDKEIVATEKPVYSEQDFNIFAGWKIKGWPILTMLRGNVIMKDGKIVEETGIGKFLASKR